MSKKIKIEDTKGGVKYHIHGPEEGLIRELMDFYQYKKGTPVVFLAVRSRRGYNILINTHTWMAIEDITFLESLEYVRVRGQK